MIDDKQMKAARALLGWKQQELADKAGLSFATIQRMESLGTGRSLANNVTAVQKVLEAGGVQFIPENGGGAGVRLAKPKAAG